MRSVLIVCKANQCRSPVAEAIFRNYVKEFDANSTWMIRSAGTWATTGRSAVRKMIMVAKERQLDLSQHRSSRIDDILPLSIFKLILTMEIGQKEALRSEFPEISDRVYTLSEMTGFEYDIEDPMSKSLDEHREALLEIERLIADGFGRIIELAS